MNEGDFLGYEENLLKELGVSRPTFRQAARVLSHEQLLTVKRGVGGGFYVRKPELDSVGQAVATYLLSRDVTLKQVSEVTSVLTTQVIGRALQSKDQFVLGKLASLRDRLEEANLKEETPATLVRWDLEFSSILAELCNNPVIELCMHLFNQFGISQSDSRIWDNNPARIKKWSKTRLKIIEAILDGDAEAAQKHGDERGRLMRSFLD